MKISVQVKPNSKHESVELAEDIYIVRVNAPPTEGKANIRVQQLLATHFGVPKSSITLLKGHKGKTKLFEVSL